jgi:sugar phosphate isomerase/epimerase
MVAQARNAGAKPAGSPLRLGMCDWNLGQRADPANITKAREAGLDGVQVSLGIGPADLALRRPDVRTQFKELAQRHSITLHSVALGMLNSIALKSEPQAAVMVVEAIEAAAVLGASNLLIPFFSRGDVRKSDAQGQFKNLSTGKYSDYELDQEGLRRVIDVLKLLLPRAEKAKIILGLENTLNAEQNLTILDQVGSPWVQVYYDVGNSAGNGYDVPSEIRRLGRERICEIHLKDRKTPILGAPGGEVDFPAAAAACRDIGYDKWLVFETSGRKGHFLEDTRANVEYARRIFGSQ